METKTCKICKIEKPINQFEVYITLTGRRKLRRQCKKCRARRITERNRIKSRRKCPICEETKQSFDFIREHSLDYKVYGKICRECAYKKNLELRKPRKKRKEKTKEQIRKYQQERYRKTKQWMVEQKGGKCAICSKKFPWYAYDFHHKDSKEKESKISRYTQLSIKHLKRSSEFKNEFKKCILVCAICHRELHLKQNELQSQK